MICNQFCVCDICTMAVALAHRAGDMAEKRDWDAGAGCGCANCQKARKILNAQLQLRQFLRIETDRIESDSRYKDKPAKVQVNAPLALIQVEMKARLMVLHDVSKWVLTG